jgi:hypothetical protein
MRHAYKPNTLKITRKRCNQVVRSSQTSMEVPIRTRRREKGTRRRLFPLYMCERIVITTLTIATLMVTPNQNV